MKHPKNIQDVLTLWESYTLKANEFYHRGEFKQATRVFSKTVDLIEPWLQKETRELHRVMHLFVLSCHNTAHSSYQMGRKKEAEFYYSHAHFRLLSLVSQPKLPSKFLEQAVNEIKSTFKQLKAYLDSMNKKQLAGNIQEESMRVIRASYMHYVEDVFMA